MKLDDLADDKNIIAALTELETTGRVELKHHLADAHHHSKVSIRCEAISNFNASEGGWRPGVFEDGRLVSAGYGNAMDKDDALNSAMRKAITHVVNQFCGDFAVTIFVADSAY